MQYNLDSLQLFKNVVINYIKFHDEAGKDLSLWNICSYFSSSVKHLHT